MKLLFRVVHLITAGQKYFSLCASFCLQSTPVQSEGCDDSSVVDSCGFVPDGAAGQSHKWQTEDNSSIISILNTQHSSLFFLRSSEGVLEKFTTYKA